MDAISEHDLSRSSAGRLTRKPSRDTVCVCAIAIHCMITVLSTSLFDNDTIMQIECDNSIFQMISFIVHGAAWQTA